MCCFSYPNHTKDKQVFSKVLQSLGKNYCLYKSIKHKSGKTLWDCEHLWSVCFIVRWYKVQQKNVLQTISKLAGHPLRGWPARLRGHKGSGLWKVWTVPSHPIPSPPLPPLPSPALPCPPPPLPPSPPSLPPAYVIQSAPTF